jgi:hypothetical protein
MSCRGGGGGDAARSMDGGLAEGAEFTGWYGER